MSGGCEFAWESDGFGWILPGGGAVMSVNGDTGPDVLLDAGDIPSTGPSTIQDDIDDLKAITNQAQLEARFPNVAGVHTIDEPAEFEPPPGGGPIVLTSGRTIVGVFPGSMSSSGGVITTITGDAAGALVSGEIPLANLRIGNINAAGSDIRADSLFGRTIVLEKVELIGEDPGVIENIFGAMEFESPSLLAPSPTAVGLAIDGIIGALAFYKGQAVAPGMTPYTAFRVLSTCTVVIVVAWLDTFMATGLAGDAFVFLDPAGTYPSSPSPTRQLGLRLTGIFIDEPGEMFAAGGLDQSDIRVYSAGNVNGASSRYLGDAVMDTGGAAAAALVNTGSPAGTLLVAPPTNGAGVDLLLGPVSERFTLTIASAVPPYRWALRFDGPNNSLSGTTAWAADIARSGGSAASVEGFTQRKRFAGTGSVKELIIDLGLPGAAPDGAYTVTVNGTPFVENAVALAKSVVVTNLRATIDAGAEPVITGPSDAAEAFEIETTTLATFTYSTSAPITIDAWEVLSESKGAIGNLPVTGVSIGGAAPIVIDSGDEFRVAASTDTPATNTDFITLKLRSQGIP